MFLRFSTRMWCQDAGNIKPPWCGPPLQPPHVFLVRTHLISFPTTTFQENTPLPNMSKPWVPSQPWAQHLVHSKHCKLCVTSWSIHTATRRLSMHGALDLIPSINNFKKKTTKSYWINIYMSQNNKAICSLLSSKSQSRFCKTSQPRGTINTQPTATFQHKCYCRMSQDLNVGVVLACCSPLSGTTLLFPVLKKFRISKNGYTAALIHQSKRCTAIQPLFVLMRSCQNYWHWQVDDPSCRTQKNTKCTAYSVALSIDTFVFSDTIHNNNKIV